MALPIGVDYLGFLTRIQYSAKNLWQRPQKIQDSTSKKGLNVCILTSTHHKVLKAIIHTIIELVKKLCSYLLILPWQYYTDTYSFTNLVPSTTIVLLIVCSSAIVKQHKAIKWNHQTRESQVSPAVCMILQFTSRNIATKKNCGSIIVIFAYNFEVCVFSKEKK